MLSARRSDSPELQHAVGAYGNHDPVRARRKYPDARFSSPRQPHKAVLRQAQDTADRLLSPAVDLMYVWDRNRSTESPTPTESGSLPLVETRARTPAAFSTADTASTPVQLPRAKTPAPRGAAATLVGGTPRESKSRQASLAQRSLQSGRSPRFGVQLRDSRSVVELGRVTRRGEVMESSSVLTDVPIGKLPPSHPKPRAGTDISYLTDSPQHGQPASHGQGRSGVS